MTATEHEPPPPEPPDLDPPRRAASATNGHRPLPQAREVEEALLGACLLHPDALHTAIDHGVTTTTFRTPAHQRIWHHLTQIHHDGLQADPRLLATRLDPGDLRRVAAIACADVPQEPAA